MDKLDKVLGRLPGKDRERIKTALVKLELGEIIGLDIRKLRGADNLFRIRVGSYRVIYQLGAGGLMTVLGIARRGDTTYNF